MPARQHGDEICSSVCSVRILYQDKYVLALDKPPGIVTVPGRGPEERSMLHEVRAVAPDALPVHRLDRDTSGVVLFAATRDAHRALNAAFESRRAEKTYLALVRGDLATGRRVDVALKASRRGGMKGVSADEQGARDAQTWVEPKERFGGHTFCTCRPRTGRTHQVRVHLASIGHPLSVDPLYGSDQPLRIGDLWSGAPDPESVVLARTPLHAATLRIPHPRGRGWLAVEAPLPDDIARCLDLLRAARRQSLP
jgi:tRNA pseudouridine32 synthase/23S rRNA pseudouridine746 synthase